MNKTYIEVTGMIDIFNINGDLIESTNWENSKHILYDNFDSNIYMLEDISYRDLLLYTVSTMNKILLNEFSYFYPNCTFELYDIRIVSIYNDYNCIYF